MDTFTPLKEKVKDSFLRRSPVKNSTKFATAIEEKNPIKALHDHRSNWSIIKNGKFKASQKTPSKITTTININNE